MCGCTPTKPDSEPAIRRVVEAHEGLCLDGKEEREELIRALAAALADRRPVVANLDYRAYTVIKREGTEGVAFT